MEEVKTLNVAVVGGGPGCKAIMNMILAKKLSRLRMKLIGLASINPKAVGYCYALEKGIYTTTDYRDLYKLKDLHMIIELTGRDEVAHEIARTKPDHIRLMDHVAGHLFWDVYDIEEKRIAERKRAQEALEQEKTEKEMILNSLLEHVVYQNLENKVLWANRAASESVDKPLEKLVGHYCYEIWAGRQSACEDCPVIKAIETEAPQTIEKTTPDGRSWFIQGYPVRQVNGIIVGAVELTLEITKRKRAEEALFNSHEKLRSLASELSLAEERQRRHVAIAVHDHIAQNLAFLKMKLGALQESTSSSSPAGTVDETLKLVDETIQNTRALISELGSPILYELGFVPAVEWLTQQIQKQHGIVVDFENDGQPKPLGEDVRVLLFQAARELLVNIAKHAKARTAKVSITTDGNQVRVDVEDDGVGFDSPEIGPSVDTTGRFGLFSIRVRLEPLGGHMEVDSKPGRGTRVTLVAPLKHNGENKREKVS